MATKTINAKCPGCRAPVQFSADMVGQALKCGKCGASFRPKARPKSDPAATIPEPGGLEIDFAVPVRVAAVSRPQLKSKSKWIVGTIVGLLLAAAGTAAFVNRDHLSSTTAIEQKKKVTPAPEPKAEEKKAESVVKPGAEQFPRRMLAISVNQYLYANPILFGSPKRSPAALLERLSDKWRIPRDQLFLLTDAKNNRGSVPPIKSIMEKTIESFVATSRSQDRIVLLYAGHATVLDGQSYLVPLDGELGLATTMIPLAWLAEKLQACKARQKLLIFDACRADVGRGAERPSPGPMDPKLEADLKSMPAGVQVWTTCAAGQSALEYQYQKYAGNDFEGSVFLNSFFHAFLKGAPAKQQPQDALPIDDLVAKVDKITQAAALGLAKQPQTPQLFGTMATAGAAYDPAEPPAARLMLPKPSELAQGGLADPKLVKAIFAEIRCPSIKSTTAEQAESGDDLDAVFPFSAEVMNQYAADYGSVTELMENAEKYPFRVGVLNAVEVLERHGRGEVFIGNTKKNVGLLREEFAGATNDAAKKAILKEQHDGPAAMYLELEDSLKALEKLGASKGDEKSKRWLAHYDYVLALTKARFAYVNEYNFVLAKIRKDELPTIDPAIHKGWRLAAVEKISSPREVKDQADDARKLFAKLIQDHPGTPWEILAKRDRLTAIGLEWQPAAIKGK